MTRPWPHLGEPLWALPAHEIAWLVRERRVTAVDVVAAHLDRVRAVNPRLNAVVQLDADGALEAASAADRRLAAGNPARPLEGVPFTAKNNLETAGIVTAIGVRERATVVPDRDATAVARLKAAGAILIGKTNCPPWGGGSETENNLYGRTFNPFGPEWSVSGSSGGEASIIAAGGSALGLGTDSGGSIRDPAHFCGIAGLKPSAGLVPVTGAIDDEGAFGMLSDIRTQVGPMARTVADLSLAMSVLAGPDGVDAGCMPVPFRDPVLVSLPGLRVAVQPDNGMASPTPETVATVWRAADALANLGCLLETASHPTGGHDLTFDIWRSYDGELSSLELHRLLRRWDAYRSAMLRWMADRDAVLGPVYPTPAHPYGQPVPRGMSYTTPYSLTGWPAVVVRCGTSPEGLPIGLQVVAAPWRDDIALRIAAALEEALGGFAWPPV